MGDNVFVEILILLAAAVVAVIAFRRMRVPSSLGYLLVGAVVGLLMVVMRALLRQATTLRADMEAVI